jgi:hypothetical protein
VDPLTHASRAIRASGYNSPFEEVAIAERLRQMGIPTIWPRAIFHTGHQTAQAPRLRDSRRFATHAEFVVPGDPPASVLLDGHDYYTIWDLYRGADPPRGVGRDAARGAIALARARDDGLITAEEVSGTLERTRERLVQVGLPADGLAAEEFVVPFDESGEAERNADGSMRLRFSLDALTAFEYGLIDETAYLELIGRMNDRLRTVDFETLDPSGRHLLLGLDECGRVLLDAAGEIHMALCNFSLIRGMYRPIR